jgi:hypothetical protein
MNLRELVFVLFPIVIPILGFVLLRAVLDRRARHRERQLQLLEEAIRNPQFDRQAVENFAYQLTGNPPPRPGPGKRNTGVKLLLACGWITLFTGLGVWVLGGMTGTDGARAAGMLVSIIGFGLVTYPFALRELEARRSPQ